MGFDTPSDDALGMNQHQSDFEVTVVIIILVVGAGILSWLMIALAGL